MSRLNNHRDASPAAIAAVGLQLFAATTATYPLETATIALKATYQPSNLTKAATDAGLKDETVIANTYQSGRHLVKTSPHGLGELWRGLIPYVGYSFLFSSGFAAFLGVFPKINPIPSAPAALELPRNIALATYRALLQPARTLYSRQITRKAARKLNPVTPNPNELWRAITDDEERKKPYLLFKPQIAALEFTSTIISAASNYALLYAVPLLYNIFRPNSIVGPSDNFTIRGQSARNADPLPVAVLAAYTAGGIALRLATEAFETVSLRLSAQETGKLPSVSEVEAKVTATLGKEGVVTRPQNYKGAIDAFTTIWKEEGFGLFRGWGVSLAFIGLQVAGTLGFTELRLRGRI